MATGRKPNIILILTDDQRWDTIRALGNPHIRTPHLDGLVETGTVFRNACIMGGTQPAVCCPSRNMLMTGRSLFRIGGSCGETIPPEHVTLPEALRANGYLSYHIGKWHQDRASFNRSFCDGARIFGFTQGWYVQYGGHWNVAVHDFDPTGQYPPHMGYLLDGDKETKLPLKPGLGGVHSSEMFSDAAVSFLDQQAKDGNRDPFFLNLAYVAPHDPRQSPEEYERRYNASNLSVPPNYLERHPFDNGEFSVRDELLEGWPRRPHAICRHLADYYACIEHLDAQIGRVLQRLEDHGMRDNTIIVFASDNGLGIGSHGLMGKQNLYEHSLRIPLMFSGPGTPAAQIRNDFCYLHDIFPTVCDLVGVKTPPSVESTSLASAIGGADSVDQRTSYHAYRDVQRAVRHGPDKLIEYVTESGRHTQLFDLDADPDEKENLAGKPEQADRLHRLRNEMENQRRLYDDNRDLEKAFWEGFAKPSDCGG